jgi:hypothetical protein
VSIYSTRFISGTAGGAWVYYTVPAGQRAVIMTATGVAPAASAAGYTLSVGGTPIISLSIPASSYMVSTNLRVVANALEQLGVYLGASVGAYYVGGYLFSAAGAHLLERDPIDHDPGWPPPTAWRGEE